MSTAIAVRHSDETLARLEEIAEQCSLQKQGEISNRFKRAFTIAAGINQLKKVITSEMMRDILELQGSSLGFRTDRDSGGGYEEGIVKECLIEALLRGASPVGNEFNIISGRCYLTKEFYKRALAEFPGLTDLRLLPGVPVMAAGGSGALVPYSATWKLGGRSMRIDRLQTKAGETTDDCRIPVKVNNGMGSDAILGKAERKIRKAIYEEITGTTSTDGEVDDGDNYGGSAAAKNSIGSDHSPETGKKVKTTQLDDTLGKEPEKKAEPAEKEPAKEETQQNTEPTKEENAGPSDTFRFISDELAKVKDLNSWLIVKQEFENRKGKLIDGEFDDLSERIDKAKPKSKK